MNFGNKTFMIPAGEAADRTGPKNEPDKIRRVFSSTLYCINMGRFFNEKLKIPPFLSENPWVLCRQPRGVDGPRLMFD